MPDREHDLTRDCWCHPTVIAIPRRNGNAQTNNDDGEQQ